MLILPYNQIDFPRTRKPRSLTFFEVYAISSTQHSPDIVLIKRLLFLGSLIVGFTH